MPLLPPVRVGLSEYWRVGEGADAKGVSFLEQVHYIWNLGMAADSAEQPQEGTTNPQIVTTVGAAEIAAA